MTARGLVVIAVGLAACGSPAESPDFERAQPAALVVESGEQADGVVTFAGDWSLDAPELRAGMTVAVDYDLARLPRCRGRKYGQPAWSVLMFWKIGDEGTLRQQVVGGPNAPAGEALPAIALDAPGTLQVWFLNSDVWGCAEWDSAYEHNHRFEVAPAPAEGWVGNTATVVSRATCDGAPCPDTGRPAEDGFVYDSWARQRATIASLFFEVWRPGVTDWDNPDVWRAIDARVGWRWAGGESDWAYVDHFDFVGNNARYAWPLRGLDPFAAPSGCPTAPFVVADGQARARLEYWLEVDGARYPAEGVFSGEFSDHAGRYADCAGD